MRRCKLISPTNLLLERPILEPVTDTEYVFEGITEYKKTMGRVFLAGVAFGLIVAVTIVFCVGILSR
jgi:hypothetical protein